MHRLAGPDTFMPEPEPFVESKPAPAAVIAPVPVAAPAPVMPATFAAVAPAAAAAPAKKSPIVPIVIGIAAVLAIVVGIVLVKRKSSAPPTPAQTASVTANRAPAALVPATASTGTLAPVSTAVPSSTQPSIDTAKVDAEVRKRLDAERTKLEQQQRAQPTPAAATPARPTPQPVVAAPQPVIPTPQPVVPAPQPVAPPPAAAPAPTPQPAVAEAPRAREGDLVPSGAEGLTPARLVRQALPVYPPLARQQRIEGTVVMNVLVSESGQVLDTKIISGVNRPVGINEAAQQTVRRSSFSAGVKDGVRVKSWTTVRVDFKL